MHHIPTLKQYILQQQLLTFYRQVIRASRTLPDSTARAETIRWFRAEIERGRHLTDVEEIRHRLVYMRREMYQVLPTARTVQSLKLV
ncbi:hypothetical protein CONPUDRAFT_44605 [Coniophora puteana RWD-64-598 SS2]|uniref:Complex 1 LYR protein domain-containing protein n=1 Tax=Coniophora puteana (strain RWD-64-598) TaxID=741705 RepID=A0A5M3N5I9_CONPW|nr:uncharacterized protein CONPUDRAFT_44605 [Coniophora puteana RWD-64-598 SS2]EIW86568.1 hypothetical protein CONPUDRAFT_44605 [Coniophora puteana RWD-64-598 SS2]